MCCAADVIDHAKRVGRQAIAAQAHAAAIESGGRWSLASPARSVSARFLSARYREPSAARPLLRVAALSAAMQPGAVEGKSPSTRWPHWLSQRQAYFSRRVFANHIRCWRDIARGCQGPIRAWWRCNSRN